MIFTNHHFRLNANKLRKKNHIIIYNELNILYNSFIDNNDKCSNPLS